MSMPGTLAPRIPHSRPAWIAPTCELRGREVRALQASVLTTGAGLADHVHSGHLASRMPHALHGMRHPRLHASFMLTKGQHKNMKTSDYHSQECTCNRVVRCYAVTDYRVAAGCATESSQEHRKRMQSSSSHLLFSVTDWSMRYVQTLVSMTYSADRTLGGCPVSSSSTSRASCSTALLGSGFHPG